MFLLDISFRQGPGRSQVLKLIIYPFTVVHDGLFHDFFYDLIYDFMIFMIYVRSPSNLMGSCLCHL